MEIICLRNKTISDKVSHNVYLLFVTLPARPQRAVLQPELVSVTLLHTDAENRWSDQRYLQAVTVDLDMWVQAFTQTAAVEGCEDEGRPGQLLT